MNPKETARETSGVKNISMFITEISEKLPTHVLPNISVLLPHLNGEVEKNNFKLKINLLFFFCASLI